MRRRIPTSTKRRICVQILGVRSGFFRSRVSDQKFLCATAATQPETPTNTGDSFPYNQCGGEYQHRLKDVSVFSDFRY